MPSAISAEQAQKWASAVQSAQGAWVKDFEGEQFSLGRAWYTHLEQGRAAQYFANVRASDASVERACPGLQSVMRELVSRVVGAPVVARPDWCGPGIHVFPAGAHVAQNGLRVWDVTYAGSDSYDDEDLERTHVTCEYEPGALVVIDSYRLHEIQPFEGARDRISATCHVALVAGAWRTWF